MAYTDVISSHQAGQLLKTSRVFGVPAASLTWGISGASKGDVEMGIKGELATAEVLDPYVTRRKDMTVFHSVSWPGGVQGDTDHILLSGLNVIIVDSKRWKKKRKYSVTPRGAIMRGSVRFPEGKVKIIHAIHDWQRNLPRGAKVRGVVCVAQKEVYVPYDKNWQVAPFKLVTLENLTDFLDRTVKPSTSEEYAYEPYIAARIFSRLIKPKPGPKQIVFK